MYRRRRPIMNWDILTADMLANLPSGQIVLFKDRARSVRWAPLRDITRIPFDRCLPVRLPGWYRRQEHLPGWYWFAKTNTLVLHESQGEKDQLILLDSDPHVSYAIAQPFATRVLHGAVTRWYTPDYLVQNRDGRQYVLEVKPAFRRSRPEWAIVEDAMRQLCETVGWEYAIAEEPEPATLETLRWLSAFRGPMPDPDGFTDTILAQCATSVPFGSLARCCGRDNELLVRPLLSHLIWSHRLHIDVTQVLDDTTLVTRGEAE